MAAFVRLLAKKGADDSVEHGDFHVKCGSNIVLSHERRTAHIKALSGGFVYSSKPIPAGGMFQVKVLQKTFIPGISIGFTRLDPDDINSVPEYVDICLESKDYWMFHGFTAYHNGTKQDMSFSKSDLVKGDSVGVRVSESGDVHYYVNGENKGVVFQHLPHHQDLWGVVFLLDGANIQSDFFLDLTTAEKVDRLQDKVSRLEVAVQERKGGAATQSGGISQGDSEEICSLRQQLTIQGQQLATQREQLTTQGQQLASQQEQLANQETRLASQGQQIEHSHLENLTREQALLQHQNEQLTTQVQQQAIELSTLQRQNHEQNQQLTQLIIQVQQQREEFQALLQQIQSLQPSWSIAQHHLQITTQVLGRGAWGEVRVGIYQGTRVAVKKMHDIIISDHNRELFEREMIIASRVRHPHLILFIGAVTTGNLTIVSELMETSLRKLLEEKKLKKSNLKPISKDVACALTYLHSLPDPIVHRDISSANVLLYAKQDSWCAKVSDFGSANFLAKLGTVAPGSVIYSAPEALDPRQQGPKMDVYSFGILLLEMCVGKLIDQHNLQAAKAAVANWTDREMKFLGEFALRCTETNPDKRPNMADFVKQI